MKAHELAGKTREALEATLQHKRRAELLDLIFSLINFEPHVTVETFAARRQMEPATVRRLIRDRKLRAHMPVTGKYRIPLSAIADFDQRTALE